MADENEAQQADTGGEAAAGAGGGKKSPLMLIVGLLVAEALVIGAVIFMFGSPSPVQAVDVTGELSEDDKAVEIPVLHEKFTNNSTGRIWVWDTELLVRTRAKYKDKVEEYLLVHNATIRTGVGEIIAGASHQHFHEPGRPTITIQLLEYFRRSIGQDQGSGEEIIDEVLIPASTGFPTDY